MIHKQVYSHGKFTETIERVKEILQVLCTILDTFK